MQTITEGNATINIYDGKISKELPVFYNPVMKLNRDISILLLNSLNKKMMQIGLPLSGSGIRGIRFVLELNEQCINSIYLNDNSKEAIKLIEKNFKLNKLNLHGLKRKGLINISQQDGNEFMLNSKGFDYIDIDPFGPPIAFLDSAIKRISRGGILAITATDTSALSGTYPKACKRKYWSNPVKDSTMHETGLRILARRVQLIGVSQQKALTPIFSYSKDHYMRIFFVCEKGKEKCDELYKHIGMLNEAGPLWLGKLWEPKLVKEMLENCDENLKKFLTTIYNESKIDQKGFYLIHDLCKKKKISVPKFDKLIAKIEKKGLKVSRTHFDDRGLRSNISYEELFKLL